VRVLVFGPTSYVGRAFIDECIRRGWEVIADVRDPTSWEIFALGMGGEAGTVLRAERAGDLLVDFAVNFAYIKNVPWYEFYHRNRLLVQRFTSAARARCAKVLAQVSSQAVFGYSFSSPPPPDRARLTLGDAYTEGKIICERAFLSDARDEAYVPAVVRLGNVIGPGAVPWTATLATTMLLGMSVGSGRANATYVGNIADYLCYIASRPEALRLFGPFHHLAEFSSVRWREIVDPMCETMRIMPSYGSNPPLTAGHLSLPALARGCGRYVAGLSRDRLPTWLTNIASALRSRLATPYSTLSGNARTLAAIMNEQYEFHPHVLNGWRPPADLSIALDLICSWLEDAGYGPL